MRFLGRKTQSARADTQSVAQSPPATGIGAIKPTPQRVAPGTEIGYHPDLIPRFQKTHETLKKLYDSVKSEVESDQFIAAQKSLDSFRKTLTGHLLEENIKLYTYLTKCLSADPDNKALMVSMKSEMGKIGTAVMAFITDYDASGITAFNKKQFLAGWGGIGETLADRIEREETSLYTMYMPPSVFQ